MTLDYEGMLKRVLTSDFAKDWMKERSKRLRSEVSFHGRERTEEEWKSDLISDFIAEPLTEIVKVLPELWEDIKEIVREQLDWNVLDKPESFEDYVGSSGLSSHIYVPFGLDEYLDHINDKLQKQLGA